ncbi:TetR/AcrR family transcriptional regulator [Paenibacillus humicus]|uniref:TetR/AcrR family transcriptional regulator n=1 Tax=Paenibacillus humicus TaxID=412861 RepID=UPI003F188AAC
MQENANKPDRRQARTKQLLYEALMDLVREKGAENVTVTDIASRANINRGTFYLHYRDVPDMLQQLKDDVFSRIRAKVEKLDIKEAWAYADRDEAYPQGVIVFDELAKHADFLRTMVGAQGDMSYALRFRELFTAHIYEKVKYVPEGKSIMPPDYFVAYVTSANFGFLMHWIESGMNLTSEEMARIMIRLMHYGPLVSLGLKEVPPGGAKIAEER